jgi:uncharacterized protein (UPF0332 family)
MSNNEVKNLLGKAKQRLGAARTLLNENYCDFSASRAYYAIFYDIEALLLSQNLAFSKHSAVITAFGKNFVKTGILDEKCHRYAVEAFDLRNIGDYDSMHSVPEEKAEELIRNAGELLRVIEEYLS